MQPPTVPLHARNFDRWYPLAIFAVGVMAYINSFGCPFIFDDTQLIVANSRIRTLWPLWQAISVPTRFLADLSFALNYSLGGVTPADFRITNLAIHLLAGWLLYGTIRRTLLLPRLAPLFGQVAAPLAASIAAVWVVHPLQTESVTYIVQRVEALMGCFYLLVLYAVARALSPGGSRLWQVVACVACLLGMGTKEVMITAPFLVLVYDGVFVAATWSEVLRARWRFHFSLFLSLAFFALLLRLSMVQQEVVGGLFYGGISRWNYLLTQFQAIPHYLRLAVVPWPLCLDYKWPLVKNFMTVLPAMVVLLPLGVLILRGVWKRRPVAFLPFAFFVLLVPTSSIIPLPDPVFEHRMYLPLAAVISLVVAGGYVLLQRWRLARSPSGWAEWIPAVAVVLVVCTFTGLVRLRNRDYASEETMWRDVLKKRPDNYRACISLSTVLVGEGRAEEVESLCRGLLGRLPDFAKMSFQEIGEARGRDWSLPCVEYAMAHNNLGAALLLRDRLEDAKAHFVEAIRVLPRATWARRNLAQTLFTAGRLDESAEEWRVILRIDPRNIPAHGFLGLVALARNQYGPAAEHYRVALGWAADDGYIRAQLAWILAACPDDRVRNGAEAVRVAKPLVQMAGPESARAYDVLAAAYAEVGDFDKALQLAGRAILLAREGRDAGLPSITGSALPQPPRSAEDSRLSLETAVRGRLELYRQKKPFRAGVSSNLEGTAFSFSGYPSSRILPPHDGHSSLPK